MQAVASVIATLMPGIDSARNSNGGLYTLRPRYYRCDTSAAQRRMIPVTTTGQETRNQSTHAIVRTMALTQNAPPPTLYIISDLQQIPPYLPARSALLARENSPIDGAAATPHAPAEV